MAKGPLTDKELMELLRASPQEGMEALLDRYTGLVWQTARSRLGDIEDVKECVNDTFLAFYRERESFDPGRGSVGTYLSAIARNLAVSRYRKNGVRGPSEPLEEAAGAADPIGAAERRLDLEGALDKLPAEDAEIIRRKYYGGMTVREIAAAMDLPYETVKKRHQRGLKKLRALLTAGLILLLAALLAACTYFVLRHFGVVPGLGVTAGAAVPAYTMAEPVSLETEDGIYNVTAAVYVEGMIYLEVRLDFNPEAARRLEESLRPFGTFNGVDPHAYRVTVNGQVVNGYDSAINEPQEIGYDTVEGHRRFCYGLAAPPPEDGTVRLSLLGVELTIPMERREAGSPGDYPCVLGDRGGLLAIPRREEGRVTVDLYALNTGKLPMAPMLVLDGYMQGDSAAITLTGEDGRVLRSDYFYDPVYHATGTMSRWDFGEAPPGRYTLRVPYVYLVAGSPEPAKLAEIPLDLAACTFGAERAPVAYGSVSILSCEAVSGDELPDWARNHYRNSSDGGWLIRLGWEPPEGGDLTPATLPVSVGRGDGSGFSAVFKMEGRTLVLFCTSKGQTREELADTVLQVYTGAQMSLLWDHVFEIPLIIE